MLRSGPTFWGSVALVEDEAEAPVCVTGTEGGGLVGLVVIAAKPFRSGGGTVTTQKEGGPQGGRGENLLVPVRRACYDDVV